MGQQQQFNGERERSASHTTLQTQASACDHAGHHTHARTHARTHPKISILGVVKEIEVLASDSNGITSPSQATTCGVELWPLAVTVAFSCPLASQLSVKLTVSDESVAAKTVTADISAPVEASADSTTCLCVHKRPPNVKSQAEGRL